MKPKCAVYARYSSENQRELSIEAQLRKCREFAFQKGWEILEGHIYIDRAKSGSHIAPRDGFRALMSVALSGNAPFQYIIVDDTSRVARNTKEALDIFENLTFRNIHVYFVSQGIDTKQDTAQEIITLHGMVDSLYLRQLSEKTRAGLKEQVLKGYNAGGRRYGYVSVPEYTGKEDRYGNKEVKGYRLVINEEEAEVVRWIFEMYGRKGYSPREIANLLNRKLEEAGWPQPPRGKFWSVSTIIGDRNQFRGILNNEIYIGKRTWNRTTTLKNPKTGSRIRRVNPPEDWIVIEEPGLRIISDELWEKVKRRQRQRKVRPGENSGSVKRLYSRNLLTPIARCGVCNGTFGIVSGGDTGKYGCTTNWNKGMAGCPSSVRIERSVLEESVLFTLYREMTDGNRIVLLCDEIMESLSQMHRIARQEDVRKKKEERLRELEEELANIENAIRRGLVFETTEKLLREAEEEKRRLLRELALLREGANGSFDFSEVITPERLRMELEAFASKLLDPEETENFLYLIVDEIFIKPEREGVVYLEIHENPELIEQIVFRLLGHLDTRISLQTGTCLQLYTSRKFQATIVLSRKGGHLDSMDDRTNIFIFRR